MGKNDPRESREQRPREYRMYDDCPIGSHGMHHFVAVDESGNVSVCDWCSEVRTK